MDIISYAAFAMIWATIITCATGIVAGLCVFCVETLKWVRR
jgi:hypothetical protein